MIRVCISITDDRHVSLHALSRIHIFGHQPAPGLSVQKQSFTCEIIMIHREAVNNSLKLNIANMFWERTCLDHYSMHPHPRPNWLIN